MTDVRLLPRNDDGDDFEYEDEHVELESELGEYGEDDGSEDNERPSRRSSAKAEEEDDDLDEKRMMPKMTMRTRKTKSLAISRPIGVRRNNGSLVRRRRRRGRRDPRRRPE